MGMDYLSTTGRIVYDPHRGDMKSRTQWWCVIDVDPEITRLFRYWMDRNWWDVERWSMKRPFVAPAWDAHVSVVRGEGYLNKKFWKKYHGQEVTLFYGLDIHQTQSSENYERPDHFWFVDVECPRIMEIRAELGLRVADEKTGKPYRSHLTVARTYDVPRNPNRGSTYWDEVKGTVASYKLPGA